MLNSACAPITKYTLEEIFKSHNIHFDLATGEQLANSVCISNPVAKVLSKCGPLSTTHKRKKYYKSHFRIIEPVEYFLSADHKNYLQYIPLLKLLHEILSHNKLLDKVIEEHTKQKNKSNLFCGQRFYRSYQDGEHYKSNSLLAVEELRISIKLYIDEFEICNPLGTSRKKT